MARSSRRPRCGSIWTCCLDCRACETACPSGVVYHELIEETRERLRNAPPPHGERVGQPSAKGRPWGERVVDAMTKRVFTRPTLLRLSLVGPRVLQRLGVWGRVAPWLERVLPPQLAKMQAMLPEGGPLWSRGMTGLYKAATGGRAPGEAKSEADSRAPDRAKSATTGRGFMRVAFFPGCVGSVLFADVNRQSVELLQAGGCDVAIPRGNACCGAIHHHGGEWEPAKQFARRNIDAYLKCFDGGPPEVIATNIAGCGAMPKGLRASAAG